jgi:hypothetical protein
MCINRLKEGRKYIAPVLVCLGGGGGGSERRKEKRTDTNNTLHISAAPFSLPPPRGVSIDRDRTVQRV